MASPFIVALRIADRPKWEKKVKAALRHGTYAEAARELGCCERLVSEWARELGAERPSGRAGWSKAI